MAFKARKWQTAAFKIADECSIDNVCDIIPVNACVGSGKTSVACYSFGKFISEHLNDKTVQMFVTPRIRLCDQQNNEIAQFIETSFGLKADIDYVIIPVDCTKSNFNKKSDTLASKHSIFVICDQSLWGTDKKAADPNMRWHQWIHKFNTYKKLGYKFGYAAFDEAHNFENKCVNLLGEAGSDEKCITDFFNLMLMSGTPASYQRELSIKHRRNVCSCPPKVAIENKWICKPSLNLIMGDTSALPSAIKAVLNHEIKLCKDEVFMPRIMVNCSGIDDINALNNVDWFKDHVGKDFHFVTLHSSKMFEDDDGRAVSAEPTIDGIKVTADEAYKAIEHIDTNEYFKDKLPILVAQVAMLSEGINVNSFNAIITSSNSDRTAMQQIGRCIRNYKYKGKAKVDDGHANVYVLTDNVQSILKLLKNLEEYDLTDECFDWGEKIDICTGAGIDGAEDGVAMLHDADWQKIDPNSDLEIIEIMGKFNGKMYKNAMDTMYKEWCAGDNNEDGKNDINELENMLEEIAHSGMLKIWSSKSFSKKESEAARRKFEHAEKLDKNGKKEEAKKTRKSIKTIPSFEIFMSWMFAIRNAMTDDVNKKLWNISPRIAMTRILGNARVAEFLEHHLSEKMISRIKKN